MRTGLLGSVLVIAAALPAFAAAPHRAPDPAAVAALLRKLDADSFPTRQRADAALRRLGKTVLPRLREEIEQTKSLEVKWRLGRIVHDLTMDERIEELVQLLGDSDAQVRARADFEIRRVGAPVVPLLQRELRPTLVGEPRQRVERLIADLDRSAH
ncbi:MAG: hypothetical protein U0736_06845 [Gemmataceae bacterium]